MKYKCFFCKEKKEKKEIYKDALLGYVCFDCKLKELIKITMLNENFT